MDDFINDNFTKDKSPGGEKKPKRTVTEFLNEVEAKKLQDQIMSRNQKENETLLPLYNVLTESLNIELVYIILKSITRFAYLHNNKEGRKSIDMKKKKTMT